MLRRSSRGWRSRGVYWHDGDAMMTTLVLSYVEALDYKHKRMRPGLSRDVGGLHILRLVASGHAAPQGLSFGPRGCDDPGIRRPAKTPPASYGYQAYRPLYHCAMLSCRGVAPKNWEPPRCFLAAQHCARAHRALRPIGGRSGASAWKVSAIKPGAQ